MIATQDSIAVVAAAADNGTAALTLVSPNSGCLSCSRVYPANEVCAPFDCGPVALRPALTPLRELLSSPDVDSLRRAPRPRGLCNTWAPLLPRAEPQNLPSADDYVIESVAPVSLDSALSNAELAWTEGGSNVEEGGAGAAAVPVPLLRIVLNGHEGHALRSAAGLLRSGRLLNLIIEVR